MRFSISLLALGAASMTGAMMSTLDLGNNIASLTGTAQNLIKDANKISFLYSPKAAVGDGSFTTILQSLASVATNGQQLSRTYLDGKKQGVYRGEDGQKIVDSLQELSTTLQKLLNTIIEKLRPLKKVPAVGDLIDTVLDTVQNLVNDLTGSLIDTLNGPGKKPSTPMNNPVGRRGDHNSE